MSTKHEFADDIQMLEERLLDPDVRRCPSQVAEIVADDFLEIGSSCRTYDKMALIAELKCDPDFDGPRSLCNFEAREIAPRVALATYQIKETGTLRSSVWRYGEGRWQLVFHQGTTAKPSSNP